MPILSNFPSGSAYLQNRVGTLETNLSALTTKFNSKNSKIVECTLLANGWSNSAPYTQSFAVEGITADWLPLEPVIISGGGSWEAEQAIRDGFIAVECVETGAGTLTFTCNEEVPTVNIPLRTHIVWEE